MLLGFDQLVHQGHPRADHVADLLPLRERTTRGEDNGYLAAAMLAATKVRNRR